MEKSFPSILISLILCIYHINIFVSLILCISNILVWNWIQGHIGKEIFLNWSTPIYKFRQGCMIDITEVHPHGCVLFLILLTTWFLAVSRDLSFSSLHCPVIIGILALSPSLSFLLTLFCEETTSFPANTM